MPSAPVSPVSLALHPTVGPNALLARIAHKILTVKIRSASIPAPALAALKRVARLLTTILHVPVHQAILEIPSIDALAFYVSMSSTN